MTTVSVMHSFRRMMPRVGHHAEKEETERRKEDLVFHKGGSIVG